MFLNVVHTLEPPCSFTRHAHILHTWEAHFRRKRHAPFCALMLQLAPAQHGYVASVAFPRGVLQADVCARASTSTWEILVNDCHAFRPQSEDMKCLPVLKVVADEVSRWNNRFNYLGFSIAVPHNMFACTTRVGFPLHVTSLPALLQVLGRAYVERVGKIRGSDDVDKHRRLYSYIRQVPLSAQRPSCQQ